jgi:spermidine synthase
MPKRLPYLFAFCTAVTSLSLEILWQEKLWWHLGTLQSTSSLILSFFFLGLGMGSLLVATKPLSQFVAKRAWVAYALLESFVLVWSVLVWFILAPAELPNWMQASTPAGTRLLAGLMILPPTIAMGATLPVLAKLARPGILYTLQLAGAAGGAWVTGFVLLPGQGYQSSYGMVLLLAACITAGALLRALMDLMAHMAHMAPKTPVVLKALISNIRPAEMQTASPATGRGTSAGFLVAAAISGFAFLAMEMIWIRLLALVHHNSAYAFQMILLQIFLAMLCGSVLINMFKKRLTLRSPGIILVVCGILSAWYLPWLLSFSGGFIPWGAGTAQEYRIILFVKGLLAVFPLALPMSLVFPALIAVHEKRQSSSGKQGFALLLGINTLFGTLGAWITPSFLIPWLGTSATLKCITFLLAGSGLFLLWRQPAQHSPTQRPHKMLCPKIGLVLFASLISLVSWMLFPLPDTGFLRADHTQRQVRLLREKESAEAVFHVLERQSERLLLVNNQYSVGGSAGIQTEHFLGEFPMQLYQAMQGKQADAIYVLGMGTGITAAAVAEQNPQTLVVTELYQDLITLAQNWFEPWNRALFTASGVSLHAADGRSFLLRNSQKYDLILGELFIPWKSGVDRLYSLEHFQTVKQRLQKGGIFVQWLPLWQMGPESFTIIVQTMHEVFPNLTLWTAGHNPQEMSVALVGMSDSNQSNLRESPALLSHYAGSLSANMAKKCPEIHQAIFPDRLLNTMDNRLLQYAAHTEQLHLLTAEKTNAVDGSTTESSMSGKHFLDFNTRLFQCTAPAEDPLLNETALAVASANRGYFYRQYLYYKQKGLSAKAQQAWKRMKRFGTPDSEQEAKAP